VQISAAGAGLGTSSLSLSVDIVHLVNSFQEGGANFSILLAPTPETRRDHHPFSPFPKYFAKYNYSATVALSLLFDNYCPIMN
jgi:hypothetical protein